MKAKGSSCIFCFSRCLWAGKSSLVCHLCAVLAVLIYKAAGKGCEQHRKEVYDMCPIPTLVQRLKWKRLCNICSVGVKRFLWQMGFDVCVGRFCGAVTFLRLPLRQWITACLAANLPLYTRGAVAFPKFVRPRCHVCSCWDLGSRSWL